MKKYFLTGVVILLPLAITLMLVFFIINLLTQPFVGFFEHFLEHFTWFRPYRIPIHFLVQLFLLIAIFFLTVLLGFLTQVLFFKSLLKLNDYVFQKIPVIKTVYKATKQISQSILGTSKKSFKQVVMVPFPVKGAYAIGLVSSPAPTLCEKATGQELISVFVATTPNPTSGYLMMYPKEEVIYLDMKIEDALKYIISCGVITSSEESNN